MACLCCKLSFITYKNAPVKKEFKETTLCFSHLIAWIYNLYVDTQASTKTGEKRRLDSCEGLAYALC